MADAVFRHEDCNYIVDRAQYLQYLRVETYFSNQLNARFL